MRVGYPPSNAPCRIIETLRKGELITEEEVRQLCYIGRELLAEEGNIQRVDAPVTVTVDLSHLLISPV